MAAQPASRIASLDLIRGIAVLGILAINIAGFAGPSLATLTPHLPTPGNTSDEVAFAAAFVLFEGKMRALFALLFGASLVLFVERADARGDHGDWLQMRRLGWLAIFGLLHFYLLWWGDILFLLAVCGMFALLAREAALKPLLIAALAVFTIWHLSGMLMGLPEVMAEERVRAGTATPAEREAYAAFLEAAAGNAQETMAQLEGGFAAQALSRIEGQTLYPLAMLFSSIGELLPLMLIGIVLGRTSFFAGEWPGRRVRALAWLGTGIGLALTAAILSWVWSRHFPLRAMEAVFLYWAAIPHLLMATGYAAILVLSAHRVSGSFLGRRVIAAGRMAFSNYIATTIVMTFLFYGWGLGLIGSYGHGDLVMFVLAMWIAILAWSEPWLRRYRRGPLEWLWRSLTEKRMLANKA